MSNPSSISTAIRPVRSTASASTTCASPPASAAVPDVAISKSGPASVPCDAPFTYTLTASNVGTAAATNVAVTDDLPDCLTGVMVSATSGRSPSVPATS
ncbi:MAG: DUF11 domain-containing protein [Blastocatellia bacterium]|nr:DUF11 domain-containing protein [Blastocatellia bacterium]